MNQPQLPAHLQNRQVRKLTDDATAGLGTSLPAHVSTEGSVFTLIDAAGNEQRLTFKGQDGREYQQPYLDAAVIDINGGTSKRYYGGKKYVKDSGEAPVCWSSNGVAPSREAQQQQARTCAECEWNKRGSATSEISGASIKACRDEKWLALTVPQIQMDTIFRFVVTPGSFKNWKAYVEAFKNGPVDISDVVTRFEWVGPDAPNVIKFSAISYIDEHTAQLAVKAHAAKATDAIVGREDVPAQIVTPPQQQTLPPAATFQPPPAPTTATTPVETPAPGRRRKAAPVQQELPLQAPFPTSQPPANGPAPVPTTQTPTNANFGIQQGVAPDPALTATLANLFPRQ